MISFSCQMRRYTPPQYAKKTEAHPDLSTTKGHIRLRDSRFAVSFTTISFRSVSRTVMAHGNVDLIIGGWGGSERSEGPSREIMFRVCVCVACVRAC